MKAWLFVATIIAPATLLAQAPRSPTTSLRIVDAQGVEVVVANVAIDYGSMITTDLQTDGIRLQQGDGSVVVKWSGVDTIRVTGTDSTSRPPKVALQVVMRSKARRPATLAEKGRMLLIGQTDLGDYQIDLHKVRLIVPVR